MLSNNLPEKIEEFLVWLEWRKIKSNNPVMFSFVKSNMRLNYYFTTGTTTVQNDNRKFLMKEYNIKTALQMELALHRNKI